MVEALGRALELYRHTAASRSAIALVLANAIPLAGVLFFGWSLWTILAIYWVENGIVGFWNVPRILLARGPGVVTRGMTTRSGIAAFFLLHYGIFWTVHGIFVLFALPSIVGASGVLGSGSFFDPGGAIGPGFTIDPSTGLPIQVASPNAFGEILWPSVAFATVILFISHGASFFFNYLGRGEFLTASPASQMWAPYGRLVVLHLTIIFGAFAIAFVGAPIGALVVLVMVKTIIDLVLHLRERRRAAAPLSPSSADEDVAAPSAA